MPIWTKVCHFIIYWYLWSPQRTDIRTDGQIHTHTSLIEYSGFRNLKAQFLFKHRVMELPFMWALKQPLDSRPRRVYPLFCDHATVFIVLTARQAIQSINNPLLKFLALVNSVKRTELGTRSVRPWWLRLHCHGNGVSLFDFQLEVLWLIKENVALIGNYELGSMWKEEPWYIAR
jgi:hypothetical protein